MHMIGHDHKCAQFHIRKMDGDFRPAGVCNLAHFIQKHLAIFDFAEKMQSIVGANRQKYIPGLA